MYGCLLVCQSVTYAQRMRKVLEHSGIQARIVRPNLQLTDGECGYAVKISDVFLAEGLEALRKNRLVPQRILIADANHRYREMKD